MNMKQENSYCTAEETHELRVHENHAFLSQHTIMETPDQVVRRQNTQWCPNKF